VNFQIYLVSCFEICQDNYIIIITLMVITVLYFLVLFIVIKYLFPRSSLFLSYAQSFDTQVLQGSIGETTKEPRENAAIVPSNCVW
jgi:hypothetical protein